MVVKEKSCSGSSSRSSSSNSSDGSGSSCLRAVVGTQDDPIIFLCF